MRLKMNDETDWSQALDQDVFEEHEICNAKEVKVNKKEVIDSKKNDKETKLMEVMEEQEEVHMQDQPLEQRGVKRKTREDKKIKVAKSRGSLLKSLT